MDHATDPLGMIPRVSYRWALCHGLCTSEQAVRRSLDGRVTMRDLRLLRGLTLDDLRRRMAARHSVTVTRQSLSRYELGQQRPRDPAVTRAWARTLGVPLRDVIIPIRTRT